MRASSAFVTTILMAGFLTGCGYDKYDPAVYPVQFDILRMFPDKVSTVTPIHIDSLNTTELLVTYFTPREQTTERYFQVENLSGSRVLERFNLEYADDNYHPMPTYVKGDLLQCGNDENYLIYLTVSDSAQTVFMYDMQREKKAELLSISLQRRGDETAPAGYASGRFVRADSYETVYVAVEYWSMVKDWHVRLFRYDPDGITEVFDRSIGVPMATIRFRDVDGDDEPELILCASAPGSGFGNERFTDTHAYTICLSLDGEILWSLDHGEGGGDVRTYYSGEQAICVRARVSFTAREGVLVRKIDLANGKVFWEQEIEGKVKIVDREGSFPELFIADEEDGNVYRGIIDSEGIKKTIISTNHDFNNSIVIPINVNGYTKYHLVREETQLFLLNESFKQCGYVENVLTMKAVTTDDSELGFVVLAKNRGRQNILLAPKKVLWTSWWITRYRRQLVFGLALPLLALAIWALVRYVRLKIRAANDYRILSQQLAEVTRSKYREQTKNTSRWADRVHNDIGHGLTRVGRLLGGIESLDGNTELSQNVKIAINEVGALVETARGLSRDIRPPETLLPLPFMLRVVAERYTSFVEIEVDVDDDIDVPEPVRAVLLGVLSESFTNIIRHAKATRVEVECRFEGDTFKLNIQDNGRGIRAEELRRTTSLGLVRMREQIASLGGRFDIEAVTSGGTVVKIELDGTWVTDEVTGEPEWVSVGFETNIGGEE